MLQKAREFFGQRFASTGLFDFNLYSLLTVSIIFTSLLTSTDFTDARATAIVFFSNCFALIVCFLVVAIVQWLWTTKSKQTELNLGILMVFGTLLGTLKGLLTWLGVSALDLGVDPLGGFVRVAISALVGTIIIPAIALFGTLRFRYAEQREALIEDTLSDEGAENYPVALVRFVEMAKERIAKAPGSNGSSLASELRDIVNSDLRPLSQKIWAREIEKFPSFRLSQIAKIAIGSHVYSALWVVPIWAVTTLPATLRVFSIEEGLVIQFVRALLLVLGLVLASRFRTTSFRGAITLYVATITILGFLQVAFGTAISTERELGDDIGFTIANLIWLFQLTLFVGMGKAFLSMGKKVEKAYDQYLSVTDLAEIQRGKELMLGDRQLAQYLHGNMQARLNSIASRLEKQTKNTDIATELELIEASLSETLSDFGSSRVSNLEDAIEGLKKDWGGVAQLAFALEPLELDKEEVQIIREVINEAISNAVRHGFAARVSTILSEGPKLVITDDGTGPRNGSPGLGTTYFDSVSDGWEIIDTASGAQLTLKLGKS